MSSGISTEGLHLDQAPPLRIPCSFFLTAPVAIAAAGVLVAGVGREIFLSPWASETLALVHLGTLGFLSIVMMGALYQITPVVAGASVPRVGLAHVVHASFVVALGLLVFGLYAHRSWAVFDAIAVLTPALLMFIVPVARALRRAPARTATVSGMRLALYSLILAAFLGLWMAHGHSAMRFPGPRPLWIQVHLGVALLGWVGGLISAVSWQVVPMFYLAPPIGHRVQRGILLGVAAGVLLPVVILVLDYFGLRGHGWSAPDRLAALGSLPAMVSVWCVQPALTWAGLGKRRRRRVDGSLLFWKLGLIMAPLTAIAAVAAYQLLDPRWDLLFGWLAIWGWAGAIVHGMLCRIVPFLVWFHRFSPLVGLAPVPSLRKLLPETTIRIGFALHLTTLVAGVAAILNPHDLLVRMTGLLLLACAFQFGESLIRVLRQRPESQPERSVSGPE
ncbi:MAG: hypothetical protein GY725_26195 [bacterium]|nr:hypothetical protein [bacterium]